MLITISIAVLNEETYLPGLIADLKAQTYAHKNIEIIFAYAPSKDQTLAILKKFEKNNDFYAVRILHNQKKIQAAAVNLVIENMRGEYLLKIDAHAKIPHNFVEKSVETALFGNVICGGNRPTISLDKSAYGRMLHTLEESMFGSNIADYRKSNEDGKFVKSIFHGMYHKSVFETCGRFDEQLLRTEDNEMHYRMRKHGYNIYLSNDIISYQYIRPTFIKMLKQKYANGYWIGLTLHVCPQCISAFHLIPMLFVLGLLFSSLLELIIPIPFLPLLLGLYAIFCLVSTVVAFIKERNILLLFLPVGFFLIHCAYGIGTIIGIIKGFAWKHIYFKNHYANKP